MNTPSHHEKVDRQLFESISENYIKKDLAPSSRIARQFRLRQALAVASVPKTCVILEVGCGGGFSVEYLKGRFSEYYGVDYAKSLIKYAENRHHASNVHFYSENIKDFKPPQPVNVILMIGVLHHLDDISQTLKMLYDMLEPGGTLVSNEPHPHNPFVSLARAVRKRIDPSYSADQKELSVSELTEFYEAAGFEDVSMIPQGVFSTPFAEVIMKPQFLVKPLAKIACVLDSIVEKLPKSIALRISWNVVAVGRRSI